MKIRLPFVGLLVLAGLLSSGSALAAAQASAPAAIAKPQPPASSDAIPAPGSKPLQERLLLVLPFENDSGKADLDWIGDAVPEIANRRLASAGFMPISRNDLLYALDHLGLPISFQPSRASAIRLAETLDADDVVVGSFSTSGKRFKVRAQILNMATLHLSAPLQEEADMPDLLDALNTMAWQLAGQLSPHFSVSLKTFQAADPNLKVSAFESYVRGVDAISLDDRIERLKQAVRLDPKYAPALFALGMAYFSDQQYDLAAVTLGRLPTDAGSAREADFYRGLAYLYTGNYEKSEDAFAFVSRQLPLPEVVNDQGVAASRRGLNAVSFFRQAAAADPTDADYQFNLAVALNHNNDVAGALAAVTQALKLRPQDAEAREFAAALRARQTHVVSSRLTQKTLVAAPNGTAQAADRTSPLERVKRSFNEAAFRQAALEMEQLQAQSLAHLPPAEHAAKLTEEGTRFLYQGLILEAEREFQAALALDGRNAAAHAGLAAVRERGGDAANARKEAERSLALQPNITAYLVLARLDVAANQLPQAADSVSHALALEPRNAEAAQLRQQLQARGQQIP